MPISHSSVYLCCRRLLHFLLTQKLVGIVAPPPKLPSLVVTQVASDNSWLLKTTHSVASHLCLLCGVVEPSVDSAARERNFSKATASRPRYVCSSRARDSFLERERPGRPVRGHEAAIGAITGFIVGSINTPRGLPLAVVCFCCFDGERGTGISPRVLRTAPIKLRVLRRTASVLAV